MNTNINKNNNKIFPDYLDLGIIKILINYLLCSNNSQQHYTFKRYKYYKDEILKLSIVSKKFHSMVSGLISNNIEGCVENWIKLNEYDHSLPQLNKQYSIIKLPVEYVIDYYNNQVLYKSSNNEFNVLSKENENIDYSKYRKIIIGKLLDSESFFKKIKQYNGYGQLEIQLFYLNSDILFQIFKRLDRVFKINKLILNESFNQSNGRQDFKIFKYLQVKHLIFDCTTGNSQVDDDSFYQHLNYGSLLNNSGGGIGYNTQYIESIKMKRNDHIEPIDLISIDKQLPNLKCLSINLLFHDLIKFKSNTNEEMINGCFDELGGLLNCNSIKQDFNQMINSILLCKSLKSLSIKNLCKKGNHCYTYSTIVDSEIIYSFLNGLKDIMSTNTIQYLKFENLDFIGIINDNINIFEPLIINKSIKSFQLVLLNMPNSITYDSILNFIISNVLTVNTTIKYLKLSIDNSSSITILKLLIDNINDIKGLYHIKLLINESQFNQIFDLIKQFSKISFTNCSIKEITLSLIHKNSFYQFKNIQFTTEYKHIKKRINNWNNLPNKINNLILNLEPFNNKN